MNGCLNEYRRDKVKDFMNHVRRQHRQLDSVLVEAYFKGRIKSGQHYSRLLKVKQHMLPSTSLFQVAVNVRKKDLLSRSQAGVVS